MRFYSVLTKVSLLLAASCAVLGVLQILPIDQTIFFVGGSLFAAHIYDKTAKRLPPILPARQLKWRAFSLNPSERTVA